MAVLPPDSPSHPLQGINQGLPVTPDVAPAPTRLATPEEEHVIAMLNNFKDIFKIKNAALPGLKNHCIPFELDSDIQKVVKGLKEGNIGVSILKELFGAMIRIKKGAIAEQQIEELKNRNLDEVNAQKNSERRFWTAIGVAVLAIVFFSIAFAISSDWASSSIASAVGGAVGALIGTIIYCNTRKKTTHSDTKVDIEDINKAYQNVKNAILGFCENKKAQNPEMQNAIDAINKMDAAQQIVRQ